MLNAYFGQLMWLLGPFFMMWSIIMIIYYFVTRSIILWGEDPNPSLRKWKEQQMNSVFHPFPSELHLNGNHLQCSGALGLLWPLAEYAEMQGKDQPTTSSPDPRNPPQVLQGKQWELGAKLCWGHLKEGTFALQLKVTSPVISGDSSSWECVRAE